MFGKGSHLFTVFCRGFEARGIVTTPSGAQSSLVMCPRGQTTANIWRFRRWQRSALGLDNAHPGASKARFSVRVLTPTLLEASLRLHPWVKGVHSSTDLARNGERKRSHSLRDYLACDWVGLLPKKQFGRFRIRISGGDKSKC